MNKGREHLIDLICKHEPFDFGGVKARWHTNNKGRTTYGVWSGIRSIGEQYSLLQAVHVKAVNRWFACYNHNLPLPAAEVTLVSLAWLPEIYKGGARAAAKLRMGVR